MEQVSLERSSGPPRPRLLLVDDEPDLLSTLAEILEHHGYAVVSTLEGEEAVRIASLFEPNLVVTDYSLPDIDGVTAIHRIRSETPRLMRAILVSGYIPKDARLRALDENVDAIMEKPVSIPELLTQMRSRADT